MRPVFAEPIEVRLRGFIYAALILPGEYDAWTAGVNQLPRGAFAASGDHVLGALHIRPVEVAAIHADAGERGCVKHTKDTIACAGDGVRIADVALNDFNTLGP